MAARTSTTVTRALEWTCRHATNASLQATFRTRTVLNQFYRNTSTARLSTFAAPRQAQKATLSEPAAIGSTPKQASTTSIKPSNPSTTAVDSIPIARPPKQTSNSRIRFLSYHGRPGTRSKYDTNPKIPSATKHLDTFTQTHPNDSAPTDIPPRIRKKPGRSKLNYRPGFTAGDFICPQCGTHNFRPPEYTQAALQQSVVVPTKRHSRASQEQEQQQKELEGTQEKIHATSGRPLTRFQREIIPPQRKYPQGASSHCFECGFETPYNLPTPKLSPGSKDIYIRTTPQTTTAAAGRDDTEMTFSSSSPSSSPTSYTSQQYRNDIRLAKARDYVCPECQTVNYSNRLYCVGCGVLAPWIQKQIEQGAVNTNRESKKVW